MIIFSSIYSYSSVLIDVPAEYAKRIKLWGKDNISNNLLFKEDNFSGREDHIHITVLYGLFLKKKDQVEELLKNYGPIHIKLGKISKFSQENHDVIKIDVNSPELHRLNSFIESNFKNNNKHPKYIPHVTIAYVKKDSCNSLIGDSEFSDIEFEVDYVLFSSKDGDKNKIVIK
jgi:2'-5' RNA ligase